MNGTARLSREGVNLLTLVHRFQSPVERFSYQPLKLLKQMPGRRRALRRPGFHMFRQQTNLKQFFVVDLMAQNVLKLINKSVREEIFAIVK